MAALFGPGTYPPFFYPPTALLLWLPFALLPFAVAAGLWIGVTGFAYVVAMRPLLGGRSLIFAVGYPAVLICALLGQNALWSAALFGGAARALDRTPVLAGVLIGCLAYKPQLGLLAPLALAAAGRWRAFAAAGATVAAAGIATVAAFGSQSWTAFIAVLPVIRAWNASGVAGFNQAVSVYAAVRLLGGPERMAWTIQAVASAAAIAALLLVARRRPGGAAEMSMLAVATSLCLPYFGDYDLTVCAVPGGWLASEAVRTGWLSHERAALAVLFVAPLAIKIVAVAPGIPLAPVALTGLAALVIRRALVAAASPRPSAPALTLAGGVLNATSPARHRTPRTPRAGTPASAPPAG